VDAEQEVVDHLLTTTRSVRRRLDLTRPVPREVLLECIAVSEQAPIGSNDTSRWRWVVVDDPATRAEIAALYRGVWDEYAEGAARTEMDERAHRTLGSAAFLAEHLHEIPALVIPCLRRHRWPARVDANLIHTVATGLYGSIYPAIWSFCVALRARGIGSSLTTLHLNRADEVAEVLGIPDRFMQICLLPVGYYTGETFRPVDRPPPEEITGFNGWA
jgi:nitroreductase